MYPDDNEARGKFDREGRDFSARPDEHIFNEKSFANTESAGHEGKKERKPRVKGRKGMAGMLAALTIASAIGGSLLTGYVIAPAMRGGAAAGQPAVEQAPPATVLSSDVTDQSAMIGEAIPAASEQVNTVPEVAAKVIPSVVGVKTYDEVSQSGQTRTQDVGYGTGFIISSDGLILTNSHVIEHGQHISVKLNDGTTYDATVQGQDYKSDVAVLKIDAAGLKPVAIGDSDALAVGQEVVAIGNPLGEKLANTVTVGYLSSLSRQIKAGDRTYNVLQTDAAINPGNSGGVLVDANGEVIGMVTLKSMFAEVDARGNAIPSEGIGFAIPINYAINIAHQLVGEGNL